MALVRKLYWPSDHRLSAKLVPVLLGRYLFRISIRYRLYWLTQQPPSSISCPFYEGESINWSQIGIKRETCAIRNWKIIYFATYSPPALTYSSHRFTSASKPAAVLWLLDQSLLRLVGHHMRLSNVNVLEIFWHRYEPLYSINTSDSKKGKFL
jgi:hypothetical protein